MSLTEILSRYSSGYPKFVVPLEHIPYKKYNIDEIVEFGILYDGYREEEIVPIKKKLLTYYSAAEFYTNWLETYQDDILKEKIFKRFYQLTEDILGWQRANKDDVYSVFIPFDLGEMLAERKNYDEAIFVFQNSTGKLEDIEKAIEKCKYDRDGFIYDELKNMLRDLSEIEQKQLLGYAKVFKIEIRLRNIVDKKMTAVRGTNKWLENESNLKLKTVIEKCKERYDCYKNEPYNKEEKSVRLIDFTTLPELESIIRENWKHFQEEFKDHDGFFSLLVPVKNIRLDIAHARFLDNKQLATLSDRFDELDRVLELKKPWENQNTPLINASRKNTGN